MSTPHTGWTRARRRRLVGTTFGAVVLAELIAAAALLGQLAPGSAGQLAALPVAGAVVGGMRMRRAAGALPAEEREAVVGTAYRVVAAAWVFSLAYGGLAGAVGLPIPTEPAAFAVLLVVTTFFTLVLPDALRLWTAPEP